MPRKTIVAILAASLQALVPVAAIAQTPATSTVVNTGVEILAADGTLVKDSEKSYLCRCGFSEKKPFCDGAHKREGFTAP